MRNKSEKKPPLRTFEVQAHRYVREEVTFLVDAANKDEAEEKAEVILDYDSDELDWEPDYEWSTEIGCTINPVGPPAPLKQVSMQEFVDKYAALKASMRNGIRAPKK